VPVLVGAGCPVDAQLNLTQVDNRNSKKGSDSRSPEDVLLSRLAIGSVTVRCQLELLLKHYQGMTPLMALALDSWKPAYSLRLFACCCMFWLPLGGFLVCGVVLSSLFAACLYDRVQI
ncbi:unnamed protein product, partial [Polarella glacialis]